MASNKLYDVQRAMSGAADVLLVAAWYSDGSCCGRVCARSSGMFHGGYYLTATWATNTDTVPLGMMRASNPVRTRLALCVRKAATGHLIGVIVMSHGNAPTRAITELSGT